MEQSVSLQEKLEWLELVAAKYPHAAKLDSVAIKIPQAIKMIKVLVKLRDHIILHGHGCEYPKLKRKCTCGLSDTLKQLAELEKE